MNRLMVLVAVVVGIGAQAQGEMESFLPEREIITPENIEQIEEIGVLGVGAIYDVAWSHDGETAALASSIGISIYDAEDWSKPLKILNSEGAFIEVYFSADDRQIIAFPARELPWLPPEPGDLWTFEIATGERQTLVSEFTGHVNRVVASSDGSAIATFEQDVDHFRGTIQIWNTRKGSFVVLPEVDGIIHDLELSPDADQLFLFFAPYMDTAIEQIQIWDVESQTIADTWELPRGKYSQIALSGDGKTMALPLAEEGDYYLKTELWDVESKTLRQTVTITDEGIGWGRYTGEVWLNQDASLILTKEYTDHGIAFYVWDVETGLNIFEQDDEDYAPVNQFAFSPDDESLLIALHNNGVMKLDKQSREISTLLPGVLYFDNGIISPHNQFLAVLQTPFTRYKTSSQVFNLQTGSRLELPDAKLRPVAFTPDGHTAALEQDGDIILWDMDSDTITQIINVYEAAIDNALFSPDGKYLVVSVRPRFENYEEDDPRRFDWLRIYDVSSGDLVTSILDYQGRNDDLMFTADGSILMTSANIWDFEKLLSEGVESSRVYTELDRTPYRTYQAISADGRLLAVVDAREGDWNDTSIIHIFDLSSGQLLHTLDAHHGNISALDFSPDGRLLVSGSGDPDAEVRDNSVRVWDMVTGEMLTILETQRNDFIRDVGFSSDGTFIYSVRGGCPCEQWGSDSAVRIWGVPINP